MAISPHAARRGHENGTVALSRAALALALLLVAACAAPPAVAVPSPRTTAEAKAALLAAPLVDVRTGAQFVLSTYRGRAVLVMAFAVW
ncbi:MAG: hypothetical protein AAB295_02695 [Chloroflexota bacterium]